VYYRTVTVVKILKETLNKNRTVDRFINFFSSFHSFRFLFIYPCSAFDTINFFVSLFSPLPYFLFFICLRQMYDELVKSDQTTVCMFTCIAINKTKTETLDAIKDGDALSFYVFLLNILFCSYVCFQSRCVEFVFFLSDNVESAIVDLT
jgi:hypothetical protein